MHQISSTSGDICANQSHHLISLSYSLPVTIEQHVFVLLDVLKDLWIRC